jgi:hypothetical protein
LREGFYSKMKLRAQNCVLGFAALLCFIDGFLAPKGSDPGPLLTAVMGILLVRRAVIITPQSLIVIVAGCAITIEALAGNHGLVNISKPVWIVLILVFFACFGWCERLEKLWGKVN